MRTHLLSILIATLTGATLNAQTPAAAPTPAPTPAAPPAGAAPASPNVQSTINPGNLGLGNAVPSDNPLFGTELPFFDPGSEVVSWDGKSWNVVNNRMFGARFEKYLNSPVAESSDDAAYRATLREILDVLSPNQPGKSDLTKAVSLLPIAASYYNDARLCESLSNTIYGIWLARRNVAQLKKTNKALEKQIRQQIHNANVSSSYNKLKEGPSAVGEDGGSGSRRSSTRNTGNNVNIGGGGGGTPGGGNLPGMITPNDGQEQKAKDNFSQGTWTGFYLKKVQDYEMATQKNRQTIAMSEFQQKLEFQGLILQYFVQRRFEHVVMATRLYRILFKGSDPEMRFDEDSNVYKSFKFGVGMSPTITTFDAMANEAIRDVDEGVQAFEFLLAKGELESATKRLSEAFSVGEYLPGIRTLTMDKKQKILGFVRNSNQLISALDVKDYGLAATLVEKMKTQATDFDYSKPEAAIKTYTMTADMFLNKAMLAARTGDDEGVQDNLMKAHELYPTNPKLKKVSDLIVKGSDVQSQALNDLDRLMAEGNFRAIEKDQARYAAAVGLSNEPKRLEELSKVTETLRALHTRIEKSKALADSGNPEAAWETLHEVADEYGKDPEFSQLYSKSTVKAANFVHMIEEAQRHQANGQQGSSLAWYLRARQQFMKSELASSGIREIVGELIPEGGEMEDLETEL